MEKVDSERYTLAMFVLGYARALLGKAHEELEPSDAARALWNELEWLDTRIARIMTLNDEATEAGHE